MQLVTYPARVTNAPLAHTVAAGTVANRQATSQAPPNHQRDHMQVPSQIPAANKPLNCQPLDPPAPS